MIIAYTTCGSEKSARELAHAIVKERLAACANFYPVKSVFKWRGRIESAKEWLVVFKAADSKAGRLERRVKELHSYRLPAFVCFKAKGSREFERWVNGFV